MKYRSLAQRIGETGEETFSLWATKNHLCANKLGKDYGFDFHITHFLSITPSREGISGKYFLIQCKSKETEGDYITIDKSDAELYLGSNSPFCLIYINTIDQEIKFRFNDPELISKICRFITSNNRSLNIRIDDMLPSSKLEEYINRYATSKYQIEARSIIVTELLKGKITDLKISQLIDSSSRNTAIVDVKWLSDVLNPSVLFSRKTRKSRIFSVEIL